MLEIDDFLVICLINREKLGNLSSGTDFRHDFVLFRENPQAFRADVREFRDFYVENRVNRENL